MSLSILVVEDDVDLRQLLVEVLTNQAGFKVFGVGTLGSAHSVVAGNPNSFDLMILDVNLPDGDGREFCAKLRNQGFKSPVIFLTGLSNEDDVVLGFEAGADDYLAKPFNVRELLARVNAQLRHTGTP